MWLFPGAEPGALLLASGETQAGSGKNDVEDAEGDKGGGAGGKVKAVRTEPSSPAVSYMTVYVVRIRALC